MKKKIANVLIGLTLLFGLMWEADSAVLTVSTHPLLPAGGITHQGVIYFFEQLLSTGELAKEDVKELAGDYVIDFSRIVYYQDLGVIGGYLTKGLYNSVKVRTFSIILTHDEQESLERSLAIDVNLNDGTFESLESILLGEEAQAFLDQFNDQFALHVADLPGNEVLVWKEINTDPLKRVQKVKRELPFLDDAVKPTAMQMLSDELIQQKDFLNAVEKVVAKMNKDQRSIPITRIGLILAWNEYTKNHQAALKLEKRVHLSGTYRSSELLGMLLEKLKNTIHIADCCKKVKRDIVRKTGIRVTTASINNCWRVWIRKCPMLSNEVRDLKHWTNF